MENKYVKELIASKKRLSIPIMTHPGIEHIGKNVIDAVTSGKVHYEAISEVAKRYNMAASSVIMDLTVEAEAFGCEIDSPKNEVPSVIGRLVCDMESVEKLEVPSLSAARVPQFLEANRLAVENINKPVFSGCIGPYSLAGRLYDMSEIMIGIYIDPDTINLLLDKCTQFIISYCKALKEIGAMGVIMAEPAAGLLSDEDCMEYSTKYVQRIVEAVQDENFVVILHNCGNTGQCTNAMIASGAAALHFGNAVNLVSVLEQAPEDILIMGNIDPVGVMKLASSEQVYNVTKELLDKTSKYKNFVISTGCDVPPEIPEENIFAYERAIADYNASL